MPVWGDGQETVGYPQQDQVPPGYGPGYGAGYGPGYDPANGYGYVPPPGYAPPGYMPPGYVMPGHIPGPGWMPGYIVMPGPLPHTHLVRSIVALFFCWPVAIAAIVQATQVESRYSRGDYYGAVRASRSAKICANISIGVGLFFVALVFVAIFAIAGASSGGGMAGG